MRLSVVCDFRSIYKQLLLLLGCYIAAFSSYTFAEGGSYWHFGDYFRTSDPKKACDWAYQNSWSGIYANARYPSHDQYKTNRHGQKEYHCGRKMPHSRPDHWAVIDHKVEVCHSGYFWNAEEALCIKKDGECPPGQLFNVRTFSCQYLCEGGFLAPTMAMCDVPIPECPLSGGELDPYSYPPRCAGSTPPPCPDCEPKDPDQPEPEEEEPEDPEGEGTLCSDPNDPECKKENKPEDRCSKLIGPAKARCNRDRKRNRCHELGLVYNPDKKECQPIIEKKVKKKKGQTPECTMTLRASDGTTYEVPCSFTGEPDPKRPPGPGPSPEGEGEGVSFSGPTASPIEVPQLPDWATAFDDDIAELDKQTEGLRQEMGKVLSTVKEYFTGLGFSGAGTSQLPCLGETVTTTSFSDSVEFSVCLSDYEDVFKWLGQVLLLGAALMALRIVLG